MKSSHQIHLEMIEQTLQPKSAFQLEAARHKALVVRDAIDADRVCCEALLRRIEHLLGELVVPVERAAPSVPALPRSRKRPRGAAS